jgi:hypothetical protein
VARSLFLVRDEAEHHDHEPDLDLDQGMYWSGSRRNAGFLLDLGAILIESVGDDAGRVPAGLADRS